MVDNRYQAYLKSAAWQQRRRLLARHYAAKCWVCGALPAAGSPLDLHHVTYERLGRELPEDLVTVCRPCHDLIHRYLGYAGTLREATDKARDIATKVQQHQGRRYDGPRLPHKPKPPKTGNALRESELAKARNAELRALNGGKLPKTPTKKNKKPKPKRYEPPWIRADPAPDISANRFRPKATPTKRR